MSTENSVAVFAGNVEVSQRGGYIGPFAERVEGRVRRALGSEFGLKNFGINLTTLSPNSESSLLHKHTSQDEFIYILAGNPTLVTDVSRVSLQPGMCAGFPAGGSPHHLINETEEEVVFLEVGDRTLGDTVTYPQDDLMLIQGQRGPKQYAHKDGTPILTC